MMVAIFAILLFQVPDGAPVEAALLKAGERRYRLTEDGKPVGTLTLKTSVESAGGRKTAVFDDLFDVTLGDQKMRMVMKETASLDGLALLSSSRKGEGIDWTISVDKRKATVKVQGPPQTIELVGPTIGEQSALRVVCAAGQKEGTTFTLDVLSISAEELQKGHVFRCVANEILELGGKKLQAFKWTETWESKGLRNGIPTSSKVDNTFWVSPEGILLRSTSLGRMELLLESE